ncbi:hypothetical protein [Roseibium alexandrii]|uniref:Uncharacterized protein n=1 Tax=Roseibium alexandrii TaxID=388408 RepID=A0A0M7A519_9HYPH|nr:hypothetical protein [Roseibium alexandrii]CTQ69989.1 hypothetical protein LAX5112_02312 [Roseibium alexandrii]
MPTSGQSLRSEPFEGGPTTTDISPSIQGPLLSGGQGGTGTAKASRSKPGQTDLRPRADAVLGSLKNILNSPEFKSAPQLQAFLHFVVDAALNDQTEKLKGITIAVEALGRDANFDPDKDPIVRVEAARLRSRLSKYYEGSGASDQVRISIPKGGYAPAFEFANMKATHGVPASATAHHDDPPAEKLSTAPTTSDTSSASSAHSGIEELPGPYDLPKTAHLRLPSARKLLKNAVSRPQISIGWLLVTNAVCLAAGYWVGSE